MDVNLRNYIYNTAFKMIVAEGSKLNLHTELLHYTKTLRNKLDTFWTREPRTRIQLWIAEADIINTAYPLTDPYRGHYIYYNVYNNRRKVYKRKLLSK